MAGQKLLTDAMLKKLEPLLPRLPKWKKGSRPWVSNRRCLESILWVLKTGARLCDLPEEFPSPSTCWHRMYGWAQEELWGDIWEVLLGELDAKGRLKWEETFADTSFALAKRGRFIRAWSFPATDPRFLQ
jgi:transposase